MLGRPRPRLTLANVQQLQRYHWPGNVRELQHVIERAVITADGGRLAIDLPAGPAGPDPAVAVPDGADRVLTDAEVRRTGRKALVGKRPMTKVSRAVEKGETQGFMKVVVDPETRQILGAAILGTGGDEVIHSILDVMYAKAPYTVIERAMHIHPTVSELIPTMLGELKPLAP